LPGIADYTFIRSLGSGNNGHFFLARRPPRLPVEVDYVAVKVFSAESTDAAFQRATRDLGAFATVHSPYLATPYDAGRHDGVFYYAMEYLLEGSLEDAPEPVEPGRVQPALAQAARGMAALHQAGLVHRDIKPGNVLLHPDGGKLADPGLAHHFVEGVTVTGMGSLHTMQYTDPSILLGELPSADSDIWSFGVLLHRVFAGTGVYQDLPRDDALLALRRILSTSPEIDQALPVPVRDLITDCLRPAGRRPDATAVADRLEALPS